MRMTTNDVKPKYNPVLWWTAGPYPVVSIAFTGVAEQPEHFSLTFSAGKVINLFEIARAEVGL